jgi:hypothetical protein
MIVIVAFPLVFVAVGQVQEPLDERVGRDSANFTGALLVKIPSMANGIFTKSFIPIFPAAGCADARPHQSLRILGTDRPSPRFHEAWEDRTMDNLTKRDQPDRSKINMSEDFEVKYWLKALGVSRDELQRTIDKVGNSAAAVRKELRL